MALLVSPWTAEAHSVLTKLQIAFCVLAGLGMTVFGVGMIAAEKQQAKPPNASAAHVPGWLAPVAWGSFGVISLSCLGVIVTLALDREKEPGSDDEESELLPVDEPCRGRGNRIRSDDRRDDRNGIDRAGPDGIRRAGQRRDGRILDASVG